MSKPHSYQLKSLVLAFPCGLPIRESLYVKEEATYNYGPVTVPQGQYSPSPATT
uniref:hypothetical protein n=1 Tax=Trichocoleus desertorum TaxID=1481672 RepID=UPI0025B4663C|nr:hypothetical protein [Trichocoleus desertorum]